MSAFAPGDMAVLNSGGPALTVAEQLGRRVQVNWFAGDMLLQAWLLADQLTPLDEIDMRPASGGPLTLVKNGKGPSA